MSLKRPAEIIENVFVFKKSKWDLYNLYLYYPKILNKYHLRGLKIPFIDADRLTHYGSVE